MADEGGRAIYRLLRGMIDALLAARPGGHLVKGSREEILVRLPLTGAGDEERFAADLQSALADEVDEAIRRAAAFQPGHVYCHRCRAAACEHSAPPSALHVFTGYNPTGTPTWEPLAQALTALRHDDVHLLYEDKRALVTLVQDSATLRGTMLEAWQNPLCEVVGQLVAGYFRAPGNGERLALTLQVTASRSSKQGLRLGLNLLGSSAADWPAESEPPWQRPVYWARKALDSVAAPKGSGRERRLPTPGQVEERVVGILNGLGRRLRHERRGVRRRTGHAEQRHRSGKRPTRKAVDDVAAAGAGAFLVDVHNDTLVVLGDKGRTHFFTPAGRLASSVRYSKDAIEGKKRRGQWQPAPDERVVRLMKSLATGDAEPGSA
jgi:hypothetical protein